MAHNKLSIMGNITRDIETKVVGNDLTIANFSIAVNGRKKDDESSFFDCTAFGKTAEIIAQYFNKGKPILISDASIKQERWEKDGQNRSKVVIIVNDITFLPKNSADDSAASAAPVTRRDGRDQNQAAKASPPPAGNDDGEPPF